MMFVYPVHCKAATNQSSQIKQKLAEKGRELDLRTSKVIDAAPELAILGPSYLNSLKEATAKAWPLIRDGPDAERKYHLWMHRAANGNQNRKAKSEFADMC